MRPLCVLREYLYDVDIDLCILLHYNSVNVIEILEKWSKMFVFYLADASLFLVFPIIETRC